jgi:HK97 family phage prohead protease
MKNYKQKGTILTKVKDVDKKQGIVIFYTSVFDVKDSDGDITVKGAFKKTLSEGFSRLRHLKNHRIAVGLPIKEETIEDDYGLRVASKLFKGTQEADELLIQYEAFAEMGNAMEHSFGYETIQEEYNKEKDVNILKELKLWEFTTMETWGANPEALQVGIKSMNPLDLIKQLRVLRKMVKGDFKDARLEEYENQINDIESILLKEPLTPQETKHSEKDKLLSLYSNLLT